MMFGGPTEPFCVTNVTFPNSPIMKFYSTWQIIQSCDSLELISESPLPRALDSMFHFHSCEPNEFVYFNLRKNSIAQLPETVFVLLAPTENGVISKIFGGNAKTDDENLKFRPFFNDAQYGWETFNSSQLLVHFYNRMVKQSPGDGVHIEIKCSKPVERPSITKNLENCANWNFINSLGVDKIDYGEYVYREYYDSYYEGWFQNRYVDGPIKEGRSVHNWMVLRQIEQSRDQLDGSLHQILKKSWSGRSESVKVGPFTLTQWAKTVHFRLYP